MNEKHLIGVDYKQGENDYNRAERSKAQLIFDRKIWRVGDVAKFLGCTVGHVYNLAADDKIPKRKKYGLLFFIPEEILNWILEGDSK